LAKESISGHQYASGRQVHIHKDVQALEEDGVDAEEVKQPLVLGVGGEELLPGQLGAPAGSRDA
jgi:hypothetical protein